MPATPSGAYRTMNIVEATAPRSLSTIIFTVIPLYTSSAVRMLADTASRSCDCLPGSICAGSKWPNDRVRGSRTSMRTGSRSGSAGTGWVSYP